MPVGKALALGSLITTAIGTGVGIYGSVQQGKAAQDKADYDAQVKRNQAEMLRKDATQNRMRMREDNQRRLARLRATYARSGIMSDAGTPLDVYSATASKLELRIADYSSNIQRKAAALEQGADLDEWSGGNLRTAGNINALSTGLSGASSFGGDAFNFYDKIQKTNSSN